VRKPIRIAVLGAGLIGQRHIQHVKNEPKAELVAIVDPAFELSPNHPVLNGRPTTARS
jgi:predicted dehydrogenase